MTEKTMNPKTTREKTENQYGWKWIELPDYHEPTEAERELIRIIGHSYIDPESYRIISALLTKESETSKSSILNLAWIGALIYNAGKIHGIQQERKRRKKEKKAEKENNR